MGERKIDRKCFALHTIQGQTALSARLLVMPEATRSPNDV